MPSYSALLHSYSILVDDMFAALEPTFPKLIVVVAGGGAYLWGRWRYSSFFGKSAGILYFYQSGELHPVFFDVWKLLEVLFVWR